MRCLFEVELGGKAAESYSIGFHYKFLIRSRYVHPRMLYLKWQSTFPKNCFYASLIKYTYKG